MRARDVNVDRLVTGWTVSLDPVNDELKMVLKFCRGHFSLTRWDFGALLAVSLRASGELTCVKRMF